MIRDQIVTLGCFLVCAFGSFFTPVLVTALTFTNLDLCNDKRFEDEK